MNTATQQFAKLDTNNMHRLFVITCVFISSIVIAEQNIPLDLGLSLDSGNVENILNRRDWREPDEEKNSWRQQQNVTHQENYTWGAISIYEQNNQLDPILAEENEPTDLIDDREAAPKFQLRF